MPICEADPWRLQYFEHTPCPPGVRIPTEDADAWLWYPDHRWVYDKIAIALSQGIDAAPHGVAPPDFPVFSKPITNLKGMAIGSRILNTPAEYEEHFASGHMWMTLLQGRQVSSDVALIDGVPRWWRHTTAMPSGEGTFDYWMVHAADDPVIEDYCGTWIRRHLSGHTGIVNIESIGGRMIEVHLRITDQWPDLYGAGWVDALVKLYAEGRWLFTDEDRRDGYSVVLFAPHGQRYSHPPASLVTQVKQLPDISSVQITFHEDKAPSEHAMPPGGFRLAVVNAFSLQAGRAGRELLRTHFLARAA
jgi:hypothetical protein